MTRAAATKRARPVTEDWNRRPREPALSIQDNRQQAIHQQRVQLMASNSAQAERMSAFQRLANGSSAPASRPLQTKTSLKPLPGGAVVQRIEASDVALQAAIKAIETSNVSVEMIADGYKPVLSDDQKKAIENIQELRNLLRHKDKFDTRSSARKYISEALGYLSAIDPTQISKALNKFEQALYYMQLAKSMYEEHDKGSAKPLTGGSKTSYGTFSD